jgi:hypothetical protein
MQVTRRAVLAAAVLVAAGCRSKPRPRPSGADPDASVLAATIDGERELLAAYDAATAGGAAGLDVARADHATHLAALLALSGAALPSTSPSPASTGGVDARQLAATERSSAAAMQTAAVSARRGQVATTLASVAASHLAHASRAGRG